jgi:hypothetical protein
MKDLRHLIRSRRFRLGVFVFGSLYLASYLFLSFFGRYQNNSTSFDQIGRGWCWPISDRDEWQPKLVIVVTWPYSQSLFANPLGYFFLPAVYLDRLLVHPTRFVSFDAVANGNKVLAAVRSADAPSKASIQALIGSQVVFYGYPPNWRVYTGSRADLMVSSNIFLDVEIRPWRDVGPGAVNWDAKVLGTLKSVDFETRVIHIRAKPEDWRVQNAD